MVYRRGLFHRAEIVKNLYFGLWLIENAIILKAPGDTTESFFTSFILILNRRGNR